MKVKSIAIPGALGQGAIATLCAAAISETGAEFGGVLGIAVSVASTVLLLRVLMDHGLVETTVGRAAVG